MKCMQCTGRKLISASLRLYSYNMLQQAASNYMGRTCTRCCALRERALHVHAGARGLEAYRCYRRVYG